MPESAKENELLPCRYCGGSEILFEENDYGHFSWGCRSCGSGGPIVRDKEVAHLASFAERELTAKTMAAERWNRRIEKDFPAARRFSKQMPTECPWFAFVDPEEPDRWIVGWMDTNHIREEGGSSYRHNDPLLTWWIPLPLVSALNSGG